jgi:hypothetical protein
MKVKIIPCITTLIIFLIFTNTYAQYNEFGFGVSLYAAYTSSSQIYINPKSSDPYLRDTFVPLDDIHSYSINLRYRISEPLILGLNIEYMRKADYITEVTLSGPSGLKNVKVNDGYILYPLELSAYYFLPFSTEFFKYYMGGGLGVYFADHIFEFGNAGVNTYERKPFVGIQVAFGVDYFILDYLTIRGEMKFRQPDVKLKSRFETDEVEYEGETYTLIQKEFERRVVVNGITFYIGVSYQL